MRSDYVDTIHGTCPSCGEKTQGHVYCEPHAGVYGWVCPRCDTSHEPTEVEDTGEVTVTFDCEGHVEILWAIIANKMDALEAVDGPIPEDAEASYENYIEIRQTLAEPLGGERNDAGD